MFYTGFGYSNNNNPPSPTRSVWGNSYSPFRNTNVPLANMTMDQSCLPTNGSPIKSPGKNSPAGGMTSGQVIGGTGRTMKEYEDELEALKKENFNLKHRIYILMERMGITSGDEDAIRKNIGLKVEVESLRKDLIEKQELLSQAAKAIQLIEEQKEEASRNQAQYQQSLEQERLRADNLQKELEECRDRLLDTSTYYEEAFGPPEKAMETKERLHQLEEYKLSLEAEVKQLTSSLEEERSWAHELETERDQLRDRWEMEVISKEKMNLKREQGLEILRERVKELEEQIFLKDSTLQQCKNDIDERDKIIEEKNALYVEKCLDYEEISAIAEKRKKQVDQLRLSVKSRDEALTGLNNKNRSLLSQFENHYSKRGSPPNSPSVFNSNSEDSSSPRRGFGLYSPSKSSNDWDHSSQNCCSEVRSLRELSKELEEKDRELKIQEESKKQLILKLCNVQQSAESTESKFKKLEVEHRKAIQMIQGFMKRHEQFEEKHGKKDRRIMELEMEISRLRSSESTKAGKSHSSVRRNLSNEMADNQEREHGNHRRFEDMECKINGLRDQIETIKAEKTLLEKQIQVESEELQDRLQDRQLKIDVLEFERNALRDELEEKTVEMEKLQQAYDRIGTLQGDDAERLRRELVSKSAELEEKNLKVDQLTKELQVKTQNLQKLVNTELWSKNKEIAKLHNHMTTQDRSRKDLTGGAWTSLTKELSDIGIAVTFIEDHVQLNYANGGDQVDLKSTAEYMNKLLAQKNELEKEVDYLKWLKVVSKPDFEYCLNGNDRDRKYFELLRTHFKDLVKFMKDIVRNSNLKVGDSRKKIMLDVVLNSYLLSDEFVQALEGLSASDHKKDDVSLKKSNPENTIPEHTRNPMCTSSDSETFSEPDRIVSLARIGLQETRQNCANRSRFSKHTKVVSDSEDSMDYVPCHATYQNDLNDLDTNHIIQELMEMNSLIQAGLNDLRTEIIAKLGADNNICDKLVAPLIAKLENSRRFCEKLQASLEKKTHECQTLKKESKQSNARRVQLESKIGDLEKQMTDIAMHGSINEKIKKLEEDNEMARATIARLTKETDHLTLLHSQTLVENTKLTNDKLRLEQELRKSESRFDLSICTLQEKFKKEISDLNQMIDSHRLRMHELENANKDLRKHMALCEASDSAPSSSGVSSIPTDATMKQVCDDMLQDYHVYNGPQFWLPISYPTPSGRSKSSCSPDLGIESDAAVSTRPLKDTLKITESMTNLLSDEDDSCNNNRRLRSSDGDSPLPLEGLDEVETLKQENEALKRRLMKTRRALEDTFQHLSASNKNKKNVEKAITKQLLMTKNVLKKTRNYEDPPYGN